MADSPVRVGQNFQDEDGNFTHEVVVHTDEIITDPDHELAVQVPEGVGASTYGHRSPLGEALSVGTPEKQFAAENDKAKNTQK